MSQPFDLPVAFEQILETRLQGLSHSLKQPERLSQCIRQLSNLFIRGVSGDAYWKNPDHRAAYISYFAQLNFLRARAVFSEARARGFLADAEKISDWGCGPGSATWALFAEIPEAADFEVTGFDQDSTAIDEFDQWAKLLKIPAGSRKIPISQLNSVKCDTLVMSYVLNEVESWPEIPSIVKRLIVIEPSTHQAGRKLLDWRNSILKKDWHAWAPCTHQNDCPLFVHSGKDWCHHRIHWNKPSWFYELERFLPMKNETLTLSYLLLSREEPPKNLKGLTRVVGDEQEEKGKSRQMICRGPYREFLSWLHRDQISLKLRRGDLVQMDANLEPRANEIRVIFPESVKKI